MQPDDLFISGFLALTLVERLFERRFSQRANRGVCHAEWTYTALHMGYTVVFLVAAVEYFVVRRTLVWPVTLVGGGLFFAALGLRLAAIRALGRFWSLHLEIRPDHELITEGIYRYVRHPAYVAIMTEVVAVPMVLNAYGTMALALAAYIPLLLARWRREEREMIVKFGDRYRHYRAAVPAFIPYKLGRTPDATVAGKGNRR